MSFDFRVGFICAVIGERCIFVANFSIEGFKFSNVSLHDDHEGLLNFPYPL